MTVLPIAQIGDPVLRQRAREVTREELALPATQTFIDDLIETMRHANGAGLAAIQVSNAIRIVAIEVGDNPRYPYKPNIPLTILVNPLLEELSDEKFKVFEGCLSVPNLRGEVERTIGLKVTAWDRHGDELEREVWGLSAGTYQHECDHLDGKLFVDRVRDPATLCTWDMFTEFHKDAFVKRAEALVAKYGS